MSNIPYEGPRFAPRNYKGELWKSEQVIRRLRCALDNIKVRAYELGQIELHDQALAALQDDTT